MIDKYEIIRQDVLWVLKYYGSDLGKIPKEERQAERIVEFIRQLDMAEEILEAEELGLVRVIGQTTKIQQKWIKKEVKMETRCRLFTQTAPNCYVDLDVEIELVWNCLWFQLSFIL